MRTAGVAFIAALATLLALACGSDAAEPAPAALGGADQGGGNGAATSAGAAGGAAGTATNGGAAQGGAAGGTNAGAGSGGGGTSVSLELGVLAANRSVGLEWDPVPQASAYRVYFAAGAAATQADTMIEVDGARATFVHRALTNGTAYHYAISAVVGGVESSLSPGVSATPAGEWVLEELGSGLFEDVTTGQPVPRVPIEQRQHVLLFAEGYTAADLAIFHDDAEHDAGRGSDVDAWIDDVFALEPYAALREAFVVWYLPRASNTHFDGGDTAFAVPVIEGSFLGTGSIASNGETALRAWTAIDLHPVPPSDFSGGGFGTARTHTAAFLLFDPARGQASVSGRALALRRPDDDSQRVSSAFGVGHAHEFTHAFAAVRDEYLEDDNDPPAQWSETTNVVGTNVCGELPWAHLLSGGAVNPGVDALVGAFGRETHGFHPELVCLMNGTHDNAAYYGGSGLLRTDDRLCNYCRELTAFRVYSRSSVIENGDEGFATWKADYRAAFYERFPFVVPEPVPQTNDVDEPQQGTAIYEACVAGASSAKSVTSTGPRVHGCVSEE